MSVMRPFSDVDLHGFVDDQISPERRAMIVNYLNATPAEAARVESWRRQNDAIRSVFASAATEPVPIWLTIGQVALGKERLDGAGTGPASRTRSGLFSRRMALPRWSDLGLPAAMAGAVLLAFVAGLIAPGFAPRWAASIQRWFPDSPRSEALHRFAARASEAHAIYGLDPDRPAEMVETGPGVLDAWLRRRLSFPVRVPELRAAGWTLRGARVVPGVIGSAALLVYEDTLGDRLSLTIGRINNPSTFDTSYEIEEGPVLVWLDGPLAFGIATSREGPWLSDHARMLYRAVYQGQAE